ncbi:MAG: hypothetical protein ABFD54_01915 [Armatimonadota bacterium]|nr:hypothetical protein [bacterium]
MPRRLMITVVCFNISVVLSIIWGIVLFRIGLRFPDFASFSVGPGGMAGQKNLWDTMGWGVSIVGLLHIFVLAPVIRYIAANLSNLRYWAWLAGLILSGLMIFNGFQTPYIATVLGGLSLWGLLDKETLAIFVPRNEDAGRPSTDDRYR